MSIDIGPVAKLDHESFGIAFNSLQHGKPKLSYGHTAVKLGRLLGKGGTKSVYSSRLGGETLALALPNTVDHVTRATQKWQDVLREPAVTDVVRQLGFMVNSRCEVTPISIDSTAFPAITLTRYQDLPIEVRDRKNHGSSIIKGNIFTETPTVGSFIEQSQGLIDDTAALVQHGVLLGGDSFNLGRDANGLHLFLNDLAHAEFKDLGEEDAVIYAGHASMMAVEAVLGGVSYEEYTQHMEFFNGDDFHFRHGQVFREFTDRVLVEAGLAS